jgi:hypothetical protein
MIVAKHEVMTAIKALNNKSGRRKSAVLMICSREFLNTVVEVEADKKYTIADRAREEKIITVQNLRINPR